MTFEQKQRYNILRRKFLSLLSDDELNRQYKKCPNKWVWSAIELERASRDADRYDQFFDLGIIYGASISQ